jgi:hypothetical protein
LFRAENDFDHAEHRGFFRIIAGKSIVLSDSPIV